MFDRSVLIVFSNSLLICPFNSLFYNSLKHVVASMSHNIALMFNNNDIVDKNDKIILVEYK